jgi:hypothetical protein
VKPEQWQHVKEVLDALGLDEDQRGKRGELESEELDEQERIAIQIARCNAALRERASSQR